MSEFELIRQFFTNRQTSLAEVSLGIGDDCALLSTRPGKQLAISSDMLVAGRHFFADADPRLLGHKSLAVNLSDLAAMGAEPRAFTLALALPQVQPEWLAAFSAGLFELADRHGCQLIGGDTTKGPLTISITVLGELDAGQALRRSAAKSGDDIWVTGTLGDANLALKGHLHQIDLSEVDLFEASSRLHRPEPRIAAGRLLCGIANAAIDLSDGLVGDLGHILKQSGVGASLNCDSLPFGPVLARQQTMVRYDCALSGGDDYELCFTAAQDRRALVLETMRSTGTLVTRIGQIETVLGLRLLDRHNQPLNLSIHSFDHFQS